jgi:hypothetical protein
MDPKFGQPQDRKQKLKLSEMEFTRKDQTGNAKIREELNIFNINNNIVKSDHNGTITCNEWKRGRFRRKF